MNDVLQSSLTALGKVYEEGKRAADVAYAGAELSALDRTSWGIAYCLRARNVKSECIDLADRWREALGLLTGDETEKEVFAEMLRYVGKRLDRLNNAGDPVIVTRYALAGFALEASIAYDLVLAEGRQLYAMATEVAALTGFRRIAERARDVLRALSERRALAEIRWMEARGLDTDDSDVDYRPFSRTALKRPSALQTGFSSVSGRNRWFHAIVDGKPAWSNDNVIDLSPPPYRDWREAMIELPGAPGVRPDLSRFVEDARRRCRTVATAVAFRVPKNATSATEVLFDVAGELLVVDRVWVALMLHKYPKATFMCGDVTQPVAVYENGVIKALVGPIRTGVRTVAAVRHRLGEKLFQQEKTTHD